MILIVAPEPCRWLFPMVRAASRRGPVTVLAPWMLRRPDLPCRWVTYPGWTLLKAAARLWARGRTERVLAARFRMRRWTDRLAARHLRGADLVIAPSLAARQVLSAGVPGLLVHDLPLLRRLHDDLDRAAERHPGCRYLRRHRAPAEWLARQEDELGLARAVAVGSRYARECLPGMALVDLPAPVSAGAGSLTPESRRPPAPPVGGSGRRVRLAGLATGRNGSVEALVLLRRTDLELVITPGPGAEPAELLAHPRVSRGGWEGVGAVLALAWCESFSGEVAEALARGIPVVATRAASGPYELAEVAPGEVPVAALEAALSGGLAAPRLVRPAPLEDWL